MTTMSSSGTSQARDAVARAARRTAAVIERIDDPARRLPGWDWTLADIAAHVTATGEVYVGYVSGETEAAVDVSDIAGGSLARSSAEYLARYPERDPAALAPRLLAATEQLLRLTERRPADSPVVWNGQHITVGALYGIFLGELLLHGADIAAAVGERAVMDRDDARIALASALPILPLLVDPRTTAGVHARFDLRVRGGVRVVLVVADGTMSVRDAAAGGSVDCRISADPVALLLVAYGRVSQWRPILTGKLVAWGRKPWLGLRLTSYLVVP